MIRNLNIKGFMVNFLYLLSIMNFKMTGDKEMKKISSVVLGIVFFSLFIQGINPNLSALSVKGDIFAVYDRECRKCHKVNGKGCFVGRWIFKTPNFTNTKWQDNASDSRLIIAIANGKRKMPGFKGKLKDEEIVDLVKICVRSYYPPAKP